MHSSSSSSIPRVFNVERMIPINFFTSSEVALPVLTMKLACVGETLAPPILKFFNPASSMSFPADPPVGGLRKTQPAEGKEQG